MNEWLHPAASQHLPSFITAPGETDILMVVLSVILVLAILMFGSVFFRLHSLPERIAHKSHKLQFEIVAVLCLISLFTHIHLFWVAGLLLALIDIPDFGGSLSRIAGSTEKLAGIGPGEGAVDVPYERPAELRHGDGPAVVPASPELAPVSPPTSPELAPASTRS
jgi:hypothetical protein